MSVGGRVLDADGKPVFGVRVGLWQLAGDQQFRLAITDRDGRYRFVGMCPGTFRVNDERGSAGVICSTPAGGDVVADLQRK